MAVSKIYTSAERARMEAQATPVALVVRSESDATALAKIDAASQALAEVKDIWSAKRAVDGAKLLKQYARAIECSEDVAANAHGLVVEAHRTFGEHWREAEKARAGRPAEIGTDDVPINRGAPTLAELGVHRNVAAEAVKIATLADEHPDIYAALKADEIGKSKALSALRPHQEEEPFHILVDGSRFKESVRSLLLKWRGTPGQAAQILGDLVREIERGADVG